MSDQARLERLKQRSAQLTARIQKAEELLQKKERAKDTRRKILVGALVLKAVEEGEWDKGALDLLLDRHLIHGRDRDLFGLG